MLKDVILLSKNSIKDTLHSVREVDLKGVISESLRATGIRITYGVVASLNETLYRSKADLESVIPSDVRFGADGFKNIDGITVCGVRVDHWGGNVT